MGRAHLRRSGVQDQGARSLLGASQRLDRPLQRWVVHPRRFRDRACAPRGVPHVHAGNRPPRSHDDQVHRVDAFRYAILQPDSSLEGRSVDGRVLQRMGDRLESRSSDREVPYPQSASRREVQLVRAWHRVQRSPRPVREARVPARGRAWHQDALVGQPRLLHQPERRQRVLRRIAQRQSGMLRRAGAVVRGRRSLR